MSLLVLMVPNFWSVSKRLPVYDEIYHSPFQAGILPTNIQFQEDVEYSTW